MDAERLVPQQVSEEPQPIGKLVWLVLRRYGLSPYETTTSLETSPPETPAEPGAESAKASLVPSSSAADSDQLSQLVMSPLSPSGGEG